MLFGDNNKFFFHLLSLYLFRVSLGLHCRHWNRFTEKSRIENFEKPFTLHLFAGIPSVYRRFEGWGVVFSPSPTLHLPSPFGKLQPVEFRFSKDFMSELIFVGRLFCWINVCGEGWWRVGEGLKTTLHLLKNLIFSLLCLKRWRVKGILQADLCARWKCRRQISKTNISRFCPLTGKLLPSPGQSIAP